MIWEEQGWIKEYDECDGRLDETMDNRKRSRPAARAQKNVKSKSTPTEQEMDEARQDKSLLPEEDVRYTATLKVENREQPDSVEKLNDVRRPTAQNTPVNLAGAPVNLVGAPMNLVDKSPNSIGSAQSAWTLVHDASNVSSNNNAWNKWNGKRDSACVLSACFRNLE